MSDARPRGFLQLLAGVLLVPSESFREVARRPTFWSPLLVFTLLQGICLGVWLHQVDVVEFARAQAEAAGREPPPAGARDEGLLRLVKTGLGVGMLSFTPLIAVAMAGAVMFAFNFVLGDESEYAQCLAIVSWSLLVVSLFSLPSSLLVMALKGDWNVDPQMALASHLAAFLDPRDTSAALFGLAQSVDLLSFWTIFLISVGMSQVVGRSTAGCVAAVGGLWVTYVIAKVALGGLV